MTRSRKGLPRVFCIGWHKTGTSTIGSALLKLGFSVVGCRLDMVHPLRKGNFDLPLRLAGQFDAVQDVPWACLYKQLDVRYPGSRFIMTVRDEDSWLKSARRHFGSMHIPLHEWIYGKGRLTGNEQLYLERFRNHQIEAQAYFMNRPDDLLIMDFRSGDSWEKLCDFLEVEIPNGSFPHENKAPKNRNLRERIKAVAREYTPKPVRAAAFETKLQIRSMVGLSDPRNRFNNFRENRSERRSWRGPK